MDKSFINNNYGRFKLQEDTRKGSIEKYPTSILEFKKVHPSISKHPTEKPVELLEFLIKTYSNKNDLILDSCIGSGSTAIACIKEERNYIGFEIDLEYYETAIRRINNEIISKGGGKNV